MNTVLGVIIVWLHGSISEAHAVGSYPTIQSCAEGVNAAIDGWKGKDKLDPKADIHIYCRDFSVNGPKPPSSKL